MFCRVCEWCFVPAVWVSARPVEIVNAEIVEIGDVEFGGDWILLVLTR